jgi:LPXTG-site transpeptidase (sortase) family protein
MKIPALHTKKVAVPLLVVAILGIIGLVLLPFLPQVQSVAQGYTRQHPLAAKFALPYFKPPDLGVPTTGNWLVIPSANLKMEIIEGPGLEVLNNQIGVWHQTGALADNYVLAGHRLQYFRSVNQSLYHLDILQPGDTNIFVVINGAPHQYRVTTSTIVLPTDVAILDKTTEPRLTIYTCNDFNNHSRLVVTAVPIPVTPTNLQPKV